jgi:DNA polymerase-3 subunit alpha
MPHAGFVNLRVHSAYSLSEGALPIGKLLELCRRDKQPAVAVTDSSNLFGAMEFAISARMAGIQPIIGCQVILELEGGAENRGALSAEERNRGALCGLLALLVQDEPGYRNLMALVSHAFLESEGGQEPRLSLAHLRERSAGLIALTGGAEGPLGQLLRGGRRDAAEALLADLKEIFPGRLYMEIQRHGLAEEAACEEAFIDMALREDIPLVATNGTFFPDEGFFEAHDALLCIAQGRVLGDSDRRRLTENHRFKSAAEMQSLFSDLPEAIANSLVIARRCHFAPAFRAPILPAYPSGTGRDEAAELRKQTEAGLKERLETQVFTPEMPEAERRDVARPYWERRDYELEVIEQMGFPGYFLIVADFIVWAKSQGIPVGPGRGSGAGSVVAWALTITDLDPLRWGLLFERFLNPERVSMPDFDVDFCQERRDEVIRYVQKKYGHDRVAQIITFGKLQARAALRDVGRVLQMPYGQVDRICKLVPNNPANPTPLKDAIALEPRLREMQEEEETVRRLLTIALKLEGLYRHASTHAAGVVIGDRALEELVPLYRDPRSDMPVTQFNMKYVEQAGLVKFDFLGLKTLSVLAQALRHVAENGGEEIALEQIPLDDARTYEALARAETVGVFQLESSGMRDVLRKLRADRFEDIIAVVALYRPGPMDNIPSYINRKHGEEQPDYLYPSLEGILKETYGIMIYQEQVMQIAQELAGYSLGGADLLRRAMGKKIKAEMEAQRKVFVEGAVARGVPGTKASEIFDQVNKFAGYGFNKSHAAAYALVAYQTAYLKANYPVEFLAASMTFDMGNTDKLGVFRQELARLEIPLLPPDINKSYPSFAVEVQADGGKAVRYALAAIKNVGGAAMKALVAERDAGGPFKSIADFATRLDGRAVNKRQVENLACSGAFDCFDENRRRFYEGADAIVRQAAASAQERSSAQVNLFAEVGLEETTDLRLTEVSDWPQLERLRHEFEAVGFYLTAHPLESSQPLLDKLKVVPFGSLKESRGTSQGLARVAGILVGKQERTSRQGNRFAFLQLSDPSGVFEVMVFSEVLGRSRELLESGEMLFLKVDVRAEGDDMRLMAQDIQALESAAAKHSGGLQIRIAKPDALEGLKSILERERKGRNRVSLLLRLADGSVAEMALPGGYRLDAPVRRAIKTLPDLEVLEI